jgi:hypothetical protein
VLRTGRILPGCDCHACGEISYKRRTLKPGENFEDNVKMNLKKINCGYRIFWEGGGAGRLAQDYVNWWGLVLVMLSCCFLLPHC